MAQTFIVALLVAGCFVYAVWTLGPKRLRSGVAKALLQWPLPAVLKKPVTAATRMQGGCGCNGCDSPSVKPKPLVFHRRPAGQPGQTEPR
jgi:hypothetical protein